MMYTRITSTQNDKVKFLRRLYKKSRERKRSSLCIVEGFREIGIAVDAGYSVEYIFYKEGIHQEDFLQEVIHRSGCKASAVFELSAAVFEQAAYRSGSEIMLVIRTPEHDLQHLSIRENMLVAVFESPEKPGNIGAVLRSAEVLGIDAVIIAQPATDLYHPNVIRSSVGAVFTLPVATGSNREVYDFLKKNRFRILSTVLSERSIPHTEADYSGNIALIFGTEAEGLSDFWVQGSDANIVIPVQGVIDSLNLSVSAGILMYEARRRKT